ncbi:MAG: MarR family transcriptional regulator [Cellulomonadaceae bacterium]|nr:MarR family transcriptional regulator [Cellulomonadaceae bacterium]
MPAADAPALPVVRASACRPDSLAADLRISLTRAVRRLRLERSSEQITDGQYGTLAALANRGPMTPSALADDQHVQPPPMTRVINALVEAGLARRDEHPTDRRQVLVSITEAGQAEVRETRRRRNAWLAGRLAALTPQEREVLAQASVLLERITTQ